MSTRSRDLGIAAALLAFAAALWFWLIPSFAGAGDQVLLPRFITMIIGALAAMMLAGALIGSRAPADDSDPFVERGGGEPLAVLALAAVWGVYAFAINITGFYLGGAVALVACFLLMGVRRPLPIASWTFGTLIGLWLVFERLFELRLPRGAVERALLGLL